MQRLAYKTTNLVVRHTALFAVVILCVFLGLGLGIDLAHAQTSFETFGEASTLSDDSIAIIVARIIRIALSVVGIIFVVLIVYAGFLYMTASGEPGPIEKAKKIFKQTVIGLFIIFSAYGITTFILNALLDAAYGGAVTSTADDYTEFLSGSLGGGILDDHYPTRNATDIPRNTRIFVTFKEEMNVASFIKDWTADDTSSTALNTDSVLIYPTEEGSENALTAADVVVTYNDDYEIFVFDPVDYLGSADEDTNYTVVLTTNIETTDGDSAFTGSYSGGYAWEFEVSTEVDLTPPYVTYSTPGDGDSEPRNATIEITFSEAMDPVASTGTYDVSQDEGFTNIEVLDLDGDNVEGIFVISNGYKTVDFTTFDQCGEDPCGDPIYCLPGDDTMSVAAKAATIDDNDPPQGLQTGIEFNGLVDAAGNSLDGNNDGTACGDLNDNVECPDGEDTDDYIWSFTTTNDLEDTVPYIVSLNPGIEEVEISQTDEVIAEFNIQLKGSTVKTTSVSMWPDPLYEMWFSVSKYDDELLDGSQILIDHPTFVSDEDGGWDYYPVFSNNIKSTYQICMYPAIDDSTACLDPSNSDRSQDDIYCCNGEPSSTACATESDGYELPYSE